MAHTSAKQRSACYLTDRYISYTTKDLDEDLKFQWRAWQNGREDLDRFVEQDTIQRRDIQIQEAKERVMEWSLAVE